MVLSQLLPARTEDDCESLCDIWVPGEDLNQGIPKYQSEVLLLEQTYSVIL
jgi:hypothetical protein